MGLLIYQLSTFQDVRQQSRGTSSESQNPRHHRDAFVAQEPALRRGHSCRCRKLEPKRARLEVVQELFHSLMHDQSCLSEIKPEPAAQVRRLCLAAVGPRAGFQACSHVNYLGV